MQTKGPTIWYQGGGLFLCLNYLFWSSTNQINYFCISRDHLLFSHKLYTCCTKTIFIENLNFFSFFFIKNQNHIIFLIKKIIKIILIFSLKIQIILLFSLKNQNQNNLIFSLKIKIILFFLKKPPGCEMVSP